MLPRTGGTAGFLWLLMAPLLAPDDVFRPMWSKEAIADRNAKKPSNGF
jgi:hypothetical protein